MTSDFQWKPGHYEDQFVRALWTLFKPAWAGFLWHCCSRRRGVEALVPQSAALERADGGFPATAGRGQQSSSSPLGSVDTTRAGSGRDSLPRPPAWYPWTAQWRLSPLTNSPLGPSRLPRQGLDAPHDSLARVGSRLPAWPCWWGGCGATTFSVVFGWSTVVSVSQFSFC